MNSAGRAQVVFQELGTDDPQRVGGYRLAARLGAGGMGKVYLSHTPGGRAVALKVIRPELAEDPEFRRRFAQEVRAAERVQGLYTAPVIDSDTEGPQPWLATAYVPGPTLGSAVAKHGPLPVLTVLLLTAGVAEALEVVHNARIVHRDLKPSNVLLATDGPRVIDFGIARAADTTALTRSGVTIGTPAFMSPEQAAGHPVGPPSDVFALGQVAAFAALGRSAHGDGSSHAVLYRIVHEEPELSGLPSELDEVVRSCLSKDPSARPSLSEVLALCSVAADATQLRRPEDWLPGALNTAIARQYAAPSPHPTAAEWPHSLSPAASQQTPTTTPDEMQHPPTVPSTGASSHQILASDHPATAPAYPWPAQAQSVPAYGPASPVGPTWPSPLTAPGVPGPPPAQRKTIGIALGGALAVALLGGALVGYLGGESGNGTSDNTNGSGPVASKTPGSTTPVNPPGKVPTVSPPGSEVHKNVNLPEGYYLKFGEQPLVPHNSNLDDLYFSCSGPNDCVFGHYHTKLVLLDQGSQGSLGTCKQDTRYLPQEISVNRLSQGRQLCATTRDGLIALVTFEGQAPSTSPSQYVTLSVTVWRDAVPAESGS